MQDSTKGSLWVFGAVFSFTAMAVAGREVQNDLDTFELMTYRSLLGLFIVVLIASASGNLSKINLDHFGTHFMRNIFHFAGQNLWFFAIALIPFAQLFAFEFSVPIWVMLAAPFLLGERLTSMRILAICGGFIGILIVTRPWLEPLSAGIIAAALCAIGFAATTIFTKRLTKVTSITNILFWLTAMQLIFGIICSTYDGDIALPQRSSILWILIVGIGGLVAHYSLTKALSLAPATLITPIDFCRLPIIAIIGYLFYQEALNIYIIVGAVLIFISVYVNIWSETRQINPQDQKAVQ